MDERGHAVGEPDDATQPLVVVGGRVEGAQSCVSRIAIDPADNPVNVGVPGEEPDHTESLATISRPYRPKVRYALHLTQLSVFDHLTGLPELGKVAEHVSRTELHATRSAFLDHPVGLFE